MLDASNGGSLVDNFSEVPGTLQTMVVVMVEVVSHDQQII